MTLTTVAVTAGRGRVRFGAIFEAQTTLTSKCRFASLPYSGGIGTGGRKLRPPRALEVKLKLRSK